MQVRIAEVAPRDGWQSVDAYIPLEQKLDLTGRMLDAGVRRVQAGSFVSPKAIPQMKDAAALFTALLERYPDREIFALAPNLRGARDAVRCGVREVSYVISVSESHNRANINRSVAQSLDGLREIRQAFPELTVGLDLATAFGCPFEGETPLEAVLALVDAAARIGVDSVNLCDTVGVACPAQVERYVKAVRRAHPGIPLEIHIHDTRNMGVLNTWTAIQCGVERVQTALGGLGGCPFAPGASGNTATEDLVYLLHRQGIETGIDFDKLLAAAKHMRGVVDGNYSGHHINIARQESAGKGA